MVDEVIIPEYMTHIVLSKKRRKQYYKKKDTPDKRPKKYRHLTEFDSKGRLLGDDGDPVVKNPNSAGKPRLQKINGQALYSSQNEFIRSKMMNQMKEFFLPYVSELKSVRKFPICVEFIFRDTESETLPDIDNQGWIYAKAILDCMTDAGVIPDDSPEYVNCQSFSYDNSADRRELIIRINQGWV